MNLHDAQKFPAKIARYQIVEELGKGGMGVVYKAFAPHTDTFIALKTLAFKIGENEIKRFTREAQTMAKMKHPNIVTVYDIGIENNVPFFTMEYIEGGSLKSFLQNTPLKIRLFSQLMVKIGKAIAYAHKQGVVHRDLKPGNIILNKNLEPYVVDFGIAKLTEVNSSLSKTGDILGTPQYMSPQQAKGEKVDHLADIYSLGAIFYNMLAGKPPIEGKDISHILFNVVNKEPNLLRTINNKLSKDLEAICYTALAKDTKQRYQSALEFTQDIEKFLQGEQVNARTVSAWERAYSKLIKANKLVLLSLTIGFVLIVLGIWLFEKYQDREVDLYLIKATKRQKQALSLTVVHKQLEAYMQVSNLLEKALSISPNNRSIKKHLIATQKIMGLLAKKQENYLLSFALFRQCKKLGYKKADILLKNLEQDKNQQEKKHRKIISRVMQKMAQKHISKTLLDRYIFAIVKMQKPYVVKVLSPYLQSRNKQQRLLAIKILGKLGNTYTKYKNKDSVQWLLYYLKKFTNKQSIKNNEKEIEEIIWALGWLKDARANIAVYITRRIAGNNSSLWAKTQIPYKWIPLKRDVIEKNTAKDFTHRGNMSLEKGDYAHAISNYSKAIIIKHTIIEAMYTRN